MAIAVLALVGVLISLYMSAYSFGFMGNIVCGAGGCQIVQNSPWSRLWGVPVPAIGLVGLRRSSSPHWPGVQPRFAGSRAVAAAPGRRRFRRPAVFRLPDVPRGVRHPRVVPLVHRQCRLALLIFICALPEFRPLRSPE
jgi:hypothetical protein